MLISGSAKRPQGQPEEAAQGPAPLPESWLGNDFENAAAGFDDKTPQLADVSEWIKGEP